MPGESMEERLARIRSKRSAEMKASRESTTVAEPAAESPYMKLAEDDVNEVFSLKDKFDRAGKRYAVPTEILAGVASRESRVGKHLNAEGYDPEKKAYGIMQIDERYHKRRGKGPTDQAHIDQSAEILRQYRNEIDRKFPDWSDEERWRATVAAYNMGPANVKTRERLDVGTTGNNYSEDVMDRAKVFRARLSEKAKKRK